jgi:deaminated glutathione amidase
MLTAVAQFGPTIDADENLAAIERLTVRARRAGAELVVFPEESMLLAEELHEPLASVVQSAWPKFEDSMSRVAATHEIAMVVGGYEPNGSDRPNNTLLAIDSSGSTVASYRKLHLYDAFAYRESSYVTAGSEMPPVVELAGVRVGLLNCYDIRFPEIARHLISLDAELITVSAAWVAGRRKQDHWETLVRARAIENTVWVAAAGSISDDCIGDSLVVDPMGVVRAAVGDESEAIAVADISTARTEAVRRTLPALENRRIELAMSVKD